MPIPERNIQNILVGGYGAKVIDDTSLVDGNFQAIQCLTDVVIASIDMRNLEGTLTGFTIDAGTIIFGEIDTIQLTSGKLIAYKQG